jgi:hypothetical protein
MGIFMPALVASIDVFRRSSGQDDPENRPMRMSGRGGQLSFMPLDDHPADR